ncbi:aldo/keto reductase [Paenibacillus sp. HB172176]|uniref:aldo/keto reductase n=1 Tax=Paenibacillus sp. HB172176 TaxID=2493690 RepID=UPI00143BB7B9|nr:aldo/keto reductase [Paenibacillus sp. HB172176]
MQYRKLGKTELDVSILSLGASSLGSVFREVNEAECMRTVQDALELGINYIDVSPYYGLTKAETMLGKAIKDIPRDRFLLSTKAGRIEENVFDFSKQSIIRSLEQSLKRLHTDYADIVFLHDIEFVPMDVILEEALPALDQLKREGKLRFKGICGLPLPLFEAYLPQIEVDAIISYCHYSLNDTTLLDLLPLLERQNVGLVNASPLSMGLLSTRKPANWHPAGEKTKEICHQAALFCAEQGADIAQLAVQFSTSNERVPTTLVSTANPSNIRNNVHWLEQPVDEELLREVQRILEPVKDWTWPSGRGEFNQGLRMEREAK